jgi:3-hydroxy-D-aspartate aldolase
MNRELEHSKWATTFRLSRHGRGDIQTPCLVLDLDALERNIKKMGDYAKAHGMRHRVHGKMHKSVDVAKLAGRAGRRLRRLLPEGIEAEVFARGGIKDVLVSNQVRDPAKIDRLARMPKLGARTICCVDDVDNVADLSAAAQKHGTRSKCLVEIDCGAGPLRCDDDASGGEIAKAIDAAPGLKFAGIQAYQGAMQHMDPTRTARPRSTSRSPWSRTPSTR